MNSHFSRSAQRGSVLLVALMFAFIIGVALTSYLVMTSHAASMAQRSFLMNDAMNVTEASLEQTLWTFNQATVVTGGTTNSVWTGAGWTLSGSGVTPTFASRTFDSSNFPLSQNATAQAKVYVEQYDSSGVPTPFAVAKAIVTPTRGPAMVKMIKVTLARSSFFSTGLVAKNGVTFSGSNATVDSWNSNPNRLVNPTAAQVVPYSPSVRRANGSVATTNITATVNVQNADIFGYVSVGSSSTSAISLGSQGVISGDFNATGGTMDSSRITTNFTENLPDATMPAGVTPMGYYEQGHNNYITGAGNCQLPANSDINGAKYVTINGVPTYFYTVQYIDMTGNASNLLTIKPGYNVAIQVTAGSGTTAVKTAGSGGISISAGSTLAIYTAGNVDVTGDSSGNGGVANNNGQALGLQIWGTNTTPGAQSIKVSGNGSLSAVVYAPEANVSVVGNGDVFGAIVGYTANLTGNANFHYDESLANFGVSNPFKISSWHELRSQAERDQYLSQLNGSNLTF